MSADPIDDQIVWMPPATIEDMYSQTAGNQFASINSPHAGPRNEKPVPCGDAPLQLYSLGTPNGVKVTILLEELEELDLTTYDAHTINIGAGEQFDKGFVAINPNSKIPALVHKGADEGGKDLCLFESGSINIYLCDQFKAFLPPTEQAAKRAKVMNWCMFQMGCLGPFCGQFGHFFCYAPGNKVETRDYGVSRYGMEVQRLLDVLERHLSGASDGPDGTDGTDGKQRAYLVGEEYSLADIMCYPWVQWLRTGYEHKGSKTMAAEFLGLQQRCPHVYRWADSIKARPAVERGAQVNGWTSPHAKPWLVKDEEK